MGGWVVGARGWAAAHSRRESSGGFHTPTRRMEAPLNQAHANQQLTQLPMRWGLTTNSTLVGTVFSLPEILLHASGHTPGQAGIRLERCSSRAGMQAAAAAEAAGMQASSSSSGGSRAARSS